MVKKCPQGRSPSDDGVACCAGSRNGHWFNFQGGLSRSKSPLGPSGHLDLRLCQLCETGRSDTVKIHTFLWSLIRQVCRSPASHVGKGVHLIETAVFRGFLTQPACRPVISTSQVVAGASCEMQAARYACAKPAGIRRYIERGPQMVYERLIL